MGVKWADLPPDPPIDDERWYRYEPCASIDGHMDHDWPEDTRAFWCPGLGED